MIVINDLIAQWAGMATLRLPYTLAGFGLVAVLSALATLISMRTGEWWQRIDRSLFWVIGFLLVGFAVLRPIGLARDDVAYVEILNTLCPLGDCAKGVPIDRDYVWFYLVKLGLPYRPGSLRVALALSGFGVLIKLIVMDQLCRKRSLALLLFIPLCYVQYDLTQLRAGLAIAWMLVGVYFLVRSHWLLGAAAFGSNFAVHSQAIFSPGFLTYRLFGLSRWILPVGLIVMLALMYQGLYPSAIALNWLGIIPESAPYYAGMQAGAYAGIKVFPWAYLLILAYGVWLCSSMPEQRKIAEIISAGLLLGTTLAWFFAIIPTMQTRLFEFYALPLVLVAGNVGQSKLKIVATSLLAIMLYLRVEILHDWILG